MIGNLGNRNLLREYILANEWAVTECLMPFNSFTYKDQLELEQLTRDSASKSPIGPNNSSTEEVRLKIKINKY